MNNNLNNYDNLLYLYSVLKRLGCGDVNTFEQRLESQKVQYLAQLFGVSIRYNYNLYIRGPYSPNLSRDLYQIKEAKMKPMIDKFIPNELEKRFNDLKNFIKDMDARKLEIVVTLHWLIKVADLSKAQAIDRLKEWKQVNDGELKYSLNKLKKYAQIKASYN